VCASAKVWQAVPVARTELLTNATTGREQAFHFDCIFTPARPLSPSATETERVLNTPPDPGISSRRRSFVRLSEGPSGCCCWRARGNGCGNDRGPSRLDGGQEVWKMTLLGRVLFAIVATATVAGGTFAVIRYVAATN